MRRGWEEVIKTAPMPGRRKVSGVSRHAPSPDRPQDNCDTMLETPWSRLGTACLQSGGGEALFPSPCYSLILLHSNLQRSRLWPLTPPPNIREWWPRGGGRSFSDGTIRYGPSRSPSPGPGDFSPVLERHLGQIGNAEVRDPEREDAEHAVKDLFAADHDGKKHLPQPPSGLGLVYSQPAGHGNSRRGSESILSCCLTWTCVKY